MRKTQLPKSNTAGYIQLSLDDLHKQLTEHPGDPVKWNVADGDIGGELLSILSKGLYPSPLDCIREYVQNAVDAQAKTVTIRVTGNSVTIHDDGIGMNLAEVVEARKFGISPKSISTHVGFRGIGIYSGFDICNRLILTTKKTEEQNAYVVEFEFDDMKALLDAERQEAKKIRTPLTKLLSDHSQFRIEPDDSKAQYTTVQLEELSNTHIDQLADREKLRTYILRNLPIAFSDDFPYKQQISRALRDNVPGYNAVIIRLESDTADREIISRPSIPDLDNPKMGAIIGANKRPIAYYWCCLHLGGKKIPDEFIDYRGFIYKVKGFTIGDNRRLEKLFKKGNAALYWWHTGEIFVLDQTVIPNAARDDFEPGQAKVQLNAAVQDELKKIEDEASKYQQRTRADRVAIQCAQELEAIQQRMNAVHFDALDEYTKLGSILDSLKEQRKKVTSKENITDWIQYTEKLMRIARKVIDQPQESSPRPSTEIPPVPTSATLPQKSPLSDNSEDNPTSFQEQLTGNNIANRETLESPPTSLTKNLIQVFEFAGWSVDSDCTRIIQLIDMSLSDVLAQNQDLYSRLLEDLEVKLTLEQ